MFHPLLFFVSLHKTKLTYMISKNVELNPKKNKDGKQTIYIRITENRKHKRISTNVRVDKKNFNLKAKFGLWVRYGEPKHAVYNELLKKMLSEIENQIFDRDYDLKNLNKNKSFFKYSEREIKYYDKIGKERSAEKLGYAVKKLKGYLGNNSDLKFREITNVFLKKYKAYLISVKKNHINTIQADFKRIKTCINNAIREKEVSNYINPFSNFKIEYQKTNKDKLSLVEIKRIEKTNFDKNSKEWHTKNFFLFSFYCAGIRFGDLCMLKWKNVVDNRLNYTMSKIAGKNNAERSISLTGKSKKILKLYKGGNTANKEKLIFPILAVDIENITNKALKKQISSKNAIINKNLKNIGLKSKIKTNISFHIARHSFADIARKLTHNDIYGISKALGHSSLQYTQVYLATFDVDNQDSIIENVNNA
jgi:integrase